MQKEYLLLRNNHETGPHSLEELIQLGLKPFDLIWVQGRSGGWSYPSEIEALKIYLPPDEQEKAVQEQAVTQSITPTQKPAHPHIFVSLPYKNSVAIPETTPAGFTASIASENNLEARAEALRKRAQAFNGAPSTTEVRTNLNRSINSVEEDYTSWLYQTKTKKKNTVSGKQLVATALIAAGLVVGWWGGKKLFSTSATTLSSKEETLQQPAVIKTVSQNTAGGYPSTTEVLEAQPATVDKKEETATQKNKLSADGKKKGIVRVVDSPIVASGTNQSVETQEVQEVVVPENTTATPEVEKPTVEEAPKKKSGIGKIFAGIFGKKKEWPSKEETGERTAKRREDAAPVNLINDVDLRLKQDSENWMMGVQNAELTLYNRSNVQLNSAIVELSYLNEDNVLLEKKTIQFNNIGAKKSATASVLSHRTAQLLKYKIVTASGGAGSN